MEVGAAAFRRRRTSSMSARRNELENGVGGIDPIQRASSSRSMLGVPPAERTVKRLRLSKTLTIPENTTVYEACRRMASRRVDAVLLTDSNALLCGILTDKDVVTRVLANELKLEETPVSKVMSRNPVFVLSDTLAVEALQKMVLGNFRHLPVVENGEVIAMLDIAKCLYDAIARMERASEKGKAIAAAIEGVEKQWGTSLSGSNTFIEALQERMFKPTLSTIIPENPKIAILSPSDSVLNATKKMVELRSGSVIIAVDNKPQGILTSKDILMRVIIQNLPPETTIVDKVMTPKPECKTIDTSIVDALHAMHNGKILHLPVVDRDGKIIFLVNVIHVTHAAIATVGSTGGIVNEASGTMMQKLWDSTLTLGPGDEDGDLHSEMSFKLASEATDTRKYATSPSLFQPNAFSFKLEDGKGRMHRFICDTRSLAEVMAAILQRVGNDIDRNNLPQILYEDEDHDQVTLASNEDLVAAVEHAKFAGWKGLRLYLDFTGSNGHKKKYGSILTDDDFARSDAWVSAYSKVAAGAALVAGFGILAYLKKAGS